MEDNPVNTEVALLLSSKLILPISVPLQESDSGYALSKLVEHFLEGNYYNIIRDLKLGEGLFEKSLFKPGSPWSEALLDTITQYIADAEDAVSSRTRQFCVLLYGAATLQLFVQNNWTGPVSPTEPKLPFYNPEDEKHVKDCLCSNQESIYKLIRRPELLLFSKTLFSCLSEEILPSKLWWQCRYNRIFQSLLTERSSSGYYETINLIDRALSVFDTFIGDTEKSLLLTEASLYCSNFGDVSRAKKYLNSAIGLLGIDINLSGALAKRTRFQQTPYAQLVVKISKQRNTRELFDVHDSSILPVDVKLEDEALLHKISFLSIEDNEIEAMLPEEIAIILATCIHKQKCSAHDDMLKEELVAFTECILSQPSLWSFHFNALLLRSTLEKDKMKRVERAMMQVQSLVDLINQESDVSVPRLQLFFCSAIPPFWSVEKSLAELLMSLGCTKSALEIFLRLQLWEDVVFCYQRLGHKEKALKIVEDQLKIEETPTLWCLLGDVQNDPKYYEKAWELSKHRSSRSQRSLAYYYFDQKKFAESVPYFAKTVELSSLDQKVWFSYGHATTQTEDYEMATKCYRRLITLDSDSYESWNNLSNAYIKMKQKSRAWKTLQEALKCNFEEWRIWENFLLVSMDVGAFNDVIKSWHRLIDIKGKHVDEEVLGFLVDAIIQDVPDMDQRPASNFRSKALELMGHLTANSTNSAKTWYLYGKLLQSGAGALENNETMDRVVQYYQKAYRNALLKPAWEKNTDSVLEVFLYAEALADAIDQRISLASDENQIVQLKQSSKLMLKSVVSIITKQLDDSMYKVDVDKVEEIKGKLSRRLTLL